MASGSTLNCSHLEQSPAEIFLELFKYIPLHQLYYGFYNLNQRINDILHSVTELSLTLNKPEDIDDAAVDFFASSIYHLNVQHSSAVKFNRFPSLRSIVSLLPRDRQLRCIKSKDLPNLTHLTLRFAAIWDCEIMGRVCQRIISNQFPKLRYCSLWPPVFDIESVIIQTPLLTHIELNEGNLDDLCVVLNSCPNLKYLKMLVSIYAKAPTKPIQSSSVKRLNVSFICGDPNWLDNFDHLLSLLPNIKRLFFHACVVQMDFNRLSSILNKRLLHLRYFQCEIHSIRFPIKLNTLRRYHSLFNNIDLENIDDNDCRCDGLKICINGEKKG
ncbi:unnamed protein product [Rotaria socialis]|uniref:F-box/LRR-repeat protein n=1 Tax=Rotaria socialis TaxID=392032 RepID=A0A821KXX3_9BILA|nr:unnamed protein product [Rotaria socialis]CAF4739058.1 unnamed protein product [Rotaria socialis]